jgi:type I restriction-modification system DNA methylase subunit
MPFEQRQQDIHELLRNSSGIQFLRRLTAELNYDFAGDPLPTRDWTDSARDPLATDPQLFATAADGEFHVIYIQLKGEKLLRSAERQVVNSLLNNHPYALFVFSNSKQNQWHIINVKHDLKHAKRRVLRRITIGVDERLRTASERIAMLDVESISPSLFGISPLEIQKRHDEAFDVQPVTREFYRDYDRVFKHVEEMIEGFDDKSRNKEKAKREKERKRLYTQRLFNRLMFIGFIQKKGWLKFNGHTDYLATLWRDYEHEDSERKNFYRDRLKPLFFQGLSTSNEVNIIGINRGGFLKTLIGDVPYLNGGLFEESADGSDRDQNIVVPDEAIDSIINDLFERYNFTVTESTPFDVEVAVDPEMLGKVFEELVTGRNETGSYYTPKPVVSFMCRESLKGYLGSKYTFLIDEHDTSNISVPEARQLLSHLADVRVVDPACGSGAYLLGMLHELHALVRLLDTRIEQESARDDYNRKLQIITNNLYGVDKDEFAIQIARLRLWLSLAVEYEGSEPEPLPNLDFKIEAGDTLTAPSPETQGQFGLIEAVIREYQKKKAAYLKAHHGEKLTLRGEVEHLREELRRARGNENVSGFDWAIEFAEVFAPRGGTEVTMRREFGFVNEIDKQGTLIEDVVNRSSGFDIVLANPPYGASVEDHVRDLYFDRRTEGAASKDTYGLFIARGLQLLSTGGQLCYIVSDTWRTLKSHKPLRKRILQKTTVKHVLDLPGWIFNAMVNTCILTVTKQPAPDGHQLIAGDLRSITSGDWESLTKNLLAVAEHGVDVQTTEYARYTYSQKFIGSYDNHSFFIGSPRLYALMSDKQYKKLSSIADVRVGLQTSDNQYYLRKRRGVRGGYEILDESKLLTNEEIANLTDKEKRDGVDPKKHGGRHFLPYDKGGESDSEEGWLPNYYVPTQYFIDWSKAAVQRLKTATVADVKRRKGQADTIKPIDEETIASRFQNSEYYFNEGITFSPTGFYAPTYRLIAPTPFDKEGSGIFCSSVRPTFLLGILCSLLSRYVNKQFINHTVHAMPGDVSEVPIVSLDKLKESEMETYVASIIERQKAEPRYSYHLYEQKEIDRLVYRLYGLEGEDIREVELWYCRRYPRLAEAQGVMAEVQEKYKDYLARCRRILEKPPAYWRSHPILTLIAQDESARLEFKESLEADTRTGDKHPGLVLSVLKTIAAFLNTEGGTLLIGVSDSGEIKGLQRDLALFGKAANYDKLQLKLRNLCRDRLDPNPLNRIKITFEHLAEGDVCRVDVEPQDDITHVDGKDVYVRVGNRTEKLEGASLTRWIRERTSPRTRSGIRKN